MDESALVSVYERYHQQLYRYCLSILGNAEDARDALQNAMVKALRALPGERRKLELKPWLYRIAHNESIDLLRRRRGEVQIDPELLVLADSPEEVAATRERLRQLLTDLSDLPGRQREALLMRELGGLSLAEIGEAFETTPEVARQTVYEARLSLRQLEAGREMDCAKVTRQISDADGRVLRRRDLQAHLRACADCRAFRAAIEGRQRDLAAIAPLPAAAAAGLLQGLLAGAGGAGTAGAGAAGAGTGAGAAGAVGAGAGKVLVTSAVVKAVATVAVVAAVGVGAADRGGLIDAGLPQGDGGSPAQQTREQESATGAAESTPARSRERLTPNQATSARPSEGPSEDRQDGTAEQDGTAAASPNATDGSPPPQSASGSLPAAASHGQEVAASHGGGRGNGQSHAQAKGNAGKSETAPKGGSKPSDPSRDPKSTTSKPDKPKPETPRPEKVGPDVSADPPSHSSQPPKSQGATGAAGGPPSKEAR